MTTAAPPLFDPAQYDTPELALPTVDGERITRIAAKVTGTIRLDRGNPEHVDLVRASKFGETRTLTIEAIAGPPIPDYGTDTDGEITEVGITRTFTIVHVYTAEDEANG